MFGTELVYPYSASVISHGESLSSGKDLECGEAELGSALITVLALVDQ